MRYDGNVIADHVRIILQIATLVWRESFTPKVGLRGSGARAERADVGRDIGIRAYGVDDDGFNNVFARESKDVESEFAIGSSPLTEIIG